MVKQQRGAKRSCGPAASMVRIPLQQRPPLSHQYTGRTYAGPVSVLGRSGIIKQEDRGEPRVSRVPGETEAKKLRLDGNEGAADRLSETPLLPGRETGGLSDAVLLPVTTSADKQGSTEHSEDSRAAELQTVASLKVTIQQTSDSREFGQSDRQTSGLRCHVCNLTCRSLQVFQEHMVRSEHLRRLREITQSVCVSAHAPQDRGHQTDSQRWCDTCQAHFSGDVIIHRRTNQHKMCKRLCRPFCPVCERHFRTPRKFVEHIKSTEHKQQVNRQEVQEEELITVDAIGCFEGEEDEEEVDVADEEDSEDGEAESEATPQEVVLWCLFLVSCVDYATSFSTERRLGSHTAERRHTLSSCRLTELLRRGVKVKTVFLKPDPHLLFEEALLASCGRSMHCNYHK